MRVAPGNLSVTTPAEVPLSRKFDQILQFEKSGYQPETVRVERHASWGLWRNAIWLHGVFIGLIVDLNTGSGYYLDPESVLVHLTPDPQRDELLSEVGLGARSPSPVR